VNILHSYLELMESYCFNYSEKQVEDFFYLKEFPLQVKMGVSEGQKVASF